MVAWDRGGSALPWHGQAGWHGGDRRVLHFSRGSAPQNPAMNGEHHCEGCPFHLLGLACRWWGYGWSRWGNADWEMQMERCRWDQMQMGQMQKAPACPSTKGQGKEEWLHNSAPFGKQSQAPLFPLWFLYHSMPGVWCI